MPARARRVGWLLRCASRAAKLVFDFDDAPARSVCALYKAFRLHGISSKMILVDAWSQVHTAPAVALREPFVPSRNQCREGMGVLGLVGGNPQFRRDDQLSPSYRIRSSGVQADVRGKDQSLFGRYRW